MTVAEVQQKDPRRVAAGKAGMRARWGPQRVLRLDGLTAKQRQAVIAFVEALREGGQTA